MRQQELEAQIRVIEEKINTLVDEQALLYEELETFKVNEAIAKAKALGLTETENITLFESTRKRLESEGYTINKVYKDCMGIQLLMASTISWRE